MIRFSFIGAAAFVPFALYLMAFSKGYREGVSDAVEVEELEWKH